MSTSNNDAMSYQYLRQSLQEGFRMPSAPIQDNLCMESNPANKDFNANEGMIPFSANSSLAAKKKIMIEAEIRKAQLRKEQLVKERQNIEEEFKAKEMLLNAKLELVLMSLDDTRKRSTPSMPLPSNTPNGVPQIRQVIVDRNEVLRLQKLASNVSRIERSIKPPKPIGLEHLAKVDFVSIRQLVSDALDETYEVVAPGDVVILRANLTFGFGRKKAMKLDMFDSGVNEVIKVRAGHFDFLEVYINEALAVLIQRAPTFFKPMLTLHDSKTNLLLKIKGQSKKSNRDIFLVQTKDKETIGSMDKTPVECPGYVADNYTILRFPPELKFKLKAAIIASSFLIVREETVAGREQKLLSNALGQYNLN